MKKALLILLALVLILAGAIAWFWSSMGFTQAARLVPSETVALLSFPDLARSAFRWPKTTLSQIGVEPEVQAFLERPLKQLTGEGGKDEAANILIGLKPTCIFAAVLGVSSQETSMLIGFQFWGGRGDYDSAIARLHAELARYQPAPAAPVTDLYLGDEISATAYKAGVLYSARRGHWGFLTNSRAAIEQVLDRAAGRLNGKSLADTPRYKEATARLVKEPDLTFYLQTESVIDTLLAVGATMGAQAIPSQIDQVRKVEAIAGALKLDGADLRDSFFILRREPGKIGTLTHKAAVLTTRDTTAYFDFLVDFKQLFSIATYPSIAPMPAAVSIANSRLPVLVPEALGPECAIALTWSETELKPSGVFAIQVRDQAKALEVLNELLLLFPTATITDLSGAKLYNFPSLTGMLANPTLALVDGFVLIGIDPPDIERALTAMKTSETLEKATDFSAAIPAYRSANEVFGYVDVKKIFSRTYPMFRQVMSFSAIVMPNSNSMIDASKLPEALTIARHLRPIVYAQTRYADGYLIESSGPITMNQALLLGAGAASSFFKPSSTP